jgi:uncharacterized protein YndB with AHSA1/START domain
MKNLKKNFYIEAPPGDVWNALTNPVTLELWTGEPAVMSTEPGSEFSLWDGSIEGRNISFSEEKQIVQEWYFGEQEAPSIVTISLNVNGNGTTVGLLHTNIPDEDFKDILEGWDESYFGALKEFYKE